MSKAAGANNSSPPSTGVKNHGSSQSDAGTNVRHETHVIVGHRPSSPKHDQHTVISDLSSYERLKNLFMLPIYTRLFIYLSTFIFLCDSKVAPTASVV